MSTRPGKETPMKKYVVVAAMLTAFTAPVMAAEYYLVQDPTKKKCRIVETKPDSQTMVMVGTGPYATREDAIAAKKAAAECKKKDATN
jgi:hypothetical protein